MTNLMIFHAGTGTFFGLNDRDVYVIDTDKLTDEMNQEIDETGEIPDEAIDSEAAVPFPEFVKSQGTDLTWGNCIAYSPSSIREEIRESLWEIYADDEDDKAVLEWGKTATNDELNQVASYILSDHQIWGSFAEDIIEGLREGYRWSKEKK